MKKYIVMLALLPLIMFGTAACALNRLDAEASSIADNAGSYSQQKHKHSADRRSVAELPEYSEFIKTQVAFAPWDDVEGLIVKALDKARDQILVQAYVLSNKKITAALLRAHARHVKVQVLVDDTQRRKRASRVAELARAGIPVRLEMRYHSAHNKLMVIDVENPFNATVITGSMNYSDNSPYRNAENVLTITGSRVLARDYAKNWQRHAEQAVPYEDIACRGSQIYCR